MTKFVLGLMALVLTLTGCTTGVHELGRATNPQSVLINAPRACADGNIENKEIREWCLELAKLEAHRSETAIMAISEAIAAENKKQEEIRRILAINPCAAVYGPILSGVMRESHCYWGQNGTYDQGREWFRRRGVPFPETPSLR